MCSPVRRQLQRCGSEALSACCAEKRICTACADLVRGHEDLPMHCTICACSAHAHGQLCLAELIQRLSIRFRLFTAVSRGEVEHQVAAGDTCRHDRDQPTRCARVTRHDRFTQAMLVCGRLQSCTGVVCSAAMQMAGARRR